MKTCIPTTMKHCATCVYWTGERKINQFSHQAEIDNTSKTAQCICKKQFGGNAKFDAYGMCSNYEEHPAFK